ncbi:MAG: nucleoside deaminase [Planctomycetota bacterium]
MDPMQEAVAEARAGVRNGDGGPFGAVIVKDGAILARAHNEVLKTNDPTAHAEVLAIRRAATQLGTPHLTGCELYTTCEPCPMCLAAIHWARLDRVIYAETRDSAARIGFDDAKFHAAMQIPIIPLEHTPSGGAAALFAEYKGERY